MANKPMTVEEQIQKLTADVSFWRENYERLEEEHKKLGPVLVSASEDLVAARDAGNKAVALTEQAIKERDEAIRHLKIVLVHSAGRTGMQSVSKQFCASCQNPYTCPFGPANEFLDGRPVAESEAAA